MLNQLSHIGVPQICILKVPLQLQHGEWTNEGTVPIENQDWYTLQGQIRDEGTLGQSRKLQNN